MSENRTVESDDAELTKLKLALNTTLLENRGLDEFEETMLKEKIIAKIENADAIMKTFDAVSRERIYRGMITNNKGTEAERIQEAIETYDRIGKWRIANADTVLTKPLPGEEILFKAMNSVIGGTDLYGHLIWGEKLGDIKSVVEHPVSTDEATAIRMKTMEAIRITQTNISIKRGTKRYKQVYIIDLAEVSLGQLMTRSDVRAMTKAIMGAANGFFPETMWKAFIINAPFIFRSVYTMVSPFIHPVTKEKIKILSGPSKYLPEMKANGIPLDQVPENFGGKFKLLTVPTLISNFIQESGQTESSA
mmetsp:Transcript_12141/g.16429  ORF Transcript_12141/g.16429 Transcript_12141/m.16429 type:complete len:306 (+) Transcript_12141:39-956(+)